MRMQALPQGRRKSTRRYAIARRAHEDASITGGMPQEHEAIHKIARRAREDTSIAGGMPQEHKAIRDCKAKGESKGAKHTAKGVAKASAAGGHLNNHWWSTT